MASMFFLVWIIIILTFFAVIMGSTKIRFPSVRRTVAHDGHVIPRENDITCETAYGHDHGQSEGRRYIVHEDPPEGFVILNGIKRSLEECKYL